ncbi:MAG TPA: glycosyltransferase family 2 protein [Anaerolineales bacterium]|nr:glycosyltransferase family 2 protein [Anaerolineales bacterium]
MSRSPLIHFSRPVSKGLISVCIVTRNASTALNKYLRSVSDSFAGSYPYEIIVVDNESSDNTKEMLDANFPTAQYILKIPGVGFTRGINLAVSASQGEYILIATPSTEVIGDALPQLVNYLDTHSTVGVVGPKIINPNGTIQHSSKKMPHPRIALLHTLRFFGINKINQTLNEYFLYENISDDPIEVTSLTMGLLIARRKVFEDVGPLDETLFIWASDVDWCYKVEQSKWKQIFLPAVKVRHHRNLVSKKQPIQNLILYHKDLRTFYRKHYAKKASLIENLFWETLLQIRFIVQLLHHLLFQSDELSYY